jgi:hypothetical protein
MLVFIKKYISTEEFRKISNQNRLDKVPRGPPLFQPHIHLYHYFNNNNNYNNSNNSNKNKNNNNNNNNNKNNNNNNNNNNKNKFIQYSNSALIHTFSESHGKNCSSISTTSGSLSLPLASSEANTYRKRASRMTNENRFVFLLAMRT